ncbi:MAG: lysostaphin resistance A-like protein [Haloferacaceae archaeon]
MADWAAFAGFAGVVLAALLFLSYLSRDVVDADGRVAPPERHAAAEGVVVGRHPARVESRGDDFATTAGRDDDFATNVEGSDDFATNAEGRVDSPATNAEGRGDYALVDAEGNERGGSNSGSHVPPSALLVNVAFSQGLFGFLLVGGAWYTQIPPAAFGVGVPTAGAVAAGVALGVGLYVVNEVGAGLSRRIGLGTAEELRAALAPQSVGGWALLLLVVLPAIAGFEEFLFRGVLVGAFSVGFGLSPWLLAALSSVAFGLGHGAQGPAGVVVTGVLGFVFAGAFVLTGSLLVVFVAHYLVNALEFVVHEGLGADWAGGR